MSVTGDTKIIICNFTTGRFSVQHIIYKNKLPHFDLFKNQLWFYFLTKTSLTFFFLHQETKMQSGQDIKLKLKLSSKDRTNRTMSIRINAQAMRYNGKPAQNILNTVQEKMLLSGQGLQLFSYIMYIYQLCSITTHFCVLKTFSHHQIEHIGYYTKARHYMTVIHFIWMYFD